jgi:hypothetical protein
MEVGTLVNNAVQSIIKGWLIAGGSLVEDKVFEDRLKICEACPRKGEVNITFGITSATVPGCLECGCPFKTKLRANTYINIEGKKTKSACPLGKW